MADVYFVTTNLIFLKGLFELSWMSSKQETKKLWTSGTIILRKSAFIVDDSVLDVKRRETGALISVQKAERFRFML